MVEGIKIVIEFASTTISVWVCSVIIPLPVSLVTDLCLQLTVAAVCGDCVPCTLDWVIAQEGN